MNKIEKCYGYLTVFGFLCLYVLQCFLIGYAAAIDDEKRILAIVCAAVSMVITMNNHYQALRWYVPFQDVAMDLAHRCSACSCLWSFILCRRNCICTSTVQGLCFG